MTQRNIQEIRDSLQKGAIFTVRYFAWLKPIIIKIKMHDILKKSKKGGKDQESIQSSTTHDQ